jgi:hypothetical protein
MDSWANLPRFDCWVICLLEAGFEIKRKPQNKFQQTLRKHPNKPAKPNQHQINDLEVEGVNKSGCSMLYQSSLMRWSAKLCLVDPSLGRCA